MYELKFNKVIKIAKDKNEVKRLVFLYMSGSVEFLLKTVEKLTNIDKAETDNPKPKKVIKNK